MFDASDIIEIFDELIYLQCRFYILLYHHLEHDDPNDEDPDDDDPIDDPNDDDPIDDGDNAGQSELLARGSHLLQPARPS